MEDYLRVGVIANTHGIRGEVKVYPTTDEKERFEDLKKVYLETEEGMRPLKIQTVRYFKNLVLLKFKGIDSINEIEKYKGNDLFISREDAVPLEEGEYFLCDILGASVETEEGVFLGQIKEILTTAANDVYVVETEDGREILLPVIEECVKSIDTQQKKVRVHLLPGLLDT